VNTKQNFQRWRSTKLARSLVLAVSLFAVFSLNPIRAHGAVERHFNLGSFTAPAGGTFAQTVGSGSFLDVYSFEFLSADSTLGLIGASVGAVGITDLMVGLWSKDKDPEIEAKQMYAASTWNFSAYTDLETNSFYELRVRGNANDPHGGAYSGGFGMLATAVSPTPEPEIYAMMGVGLAVMGWVGRRRRKQQALAAAV